MPLTPNFSVEQTIGYPERVKVTDTSTGSDGTITQRRVFFKTVAAEYLVEEGTSTDYEQWVLANTDITLDILDKDYCLVVIVQWLNSSNVVVQSKASLVLFTMYNDTFLYHLTQQQAGNPLLPSDADFYKNKMRLITLMDSATNATELAIDQYGAQYCLDLATELRLNQQYYF